ncbi:MAG TPA: hypothetical protein VGI39_18020 [Polyangiaceae bacterium]|jgi:hypothetical protein
MTHAPKCRHFTGIQNERCAAGVIYRDVGVGSKPREEVPLRLLLLGVGKLPCYQDGKTELPDTCPSRSWLTEEEHVALDAERDKRVEAFLGKLRAGVCPTCGGALAPTKQVGGCIYGACGHRIGHVGRGR